MASLREQVESSEVKLMAVPALKQQHQKQLVAIEEQHVLDMEQLHSTPRSRADHTPNGIRPSASSSAAQLEQQHAEEVASLREQIKSSEVKLMAVPALKQQHQKQLVAIEEQHVLDMEQLQAHHEAEQTTLQTALGQAQAAAQQLEQQHAADVATLREQIGSSEAMTTQQLMAVPARQAAASEAAV